MIGMQSTPKLNLKGVSINIFTNSMSAMNLSFISFLFFPRQPPQLLFPDSCSVQLTNENWRSSQRISVSANQDSWLDGATNTSLTLTVSLNSQEIYDVADKTVEVNFSLSIFARNNYFIYFFISIYFTVFFC